MNKRALSTTYIVSLFFIATAILAAPKEASISSPDGNIKVHIAANKGLLEYEVWYQDQVVIMPSRLGLSFAQHHDLAEDMRIVATRLDQRKYTWEQPWGERRLVLDHHHSVQVDAQSEISKQHMTVEFRAFNDGVAFRYLIPEQKGISEFAITDERSEFNMSKDADAWWIPARKWNRYEYLYKKTKIADMDIAHTPVTMRLANGIHVSLHEAALVNYAGMSIERRRDSNLKANLAPRADGSLVRATTPFTSPWRTIHIAPDAVGLINSDLILNLNEPNALGDVSWFKPSKYVGIWWQQHIGDRTWGRDGIHAATTEATIELMDFAAEHGFSGVLVEGWNTGWDGEWYDNGSVFSFTDAYDDFDFKKVTDHGRKVGVRLIGHHETSGDVSNYERQLGDALEMYAEHGVNSIKTGYVADAGDLKFVDEDGIVRREFHDSQASIDHHIKLLRKAAKHKIAINSHEPVKDTGLRRTYPNWVSREGARGQEYNAWATPPNGPDHVSKLVYTRMLSGPMDYTAGAFDLRPNERPVKADQVTRHDPQSRIEHTLAKELSLYIVIYSPIQMAMDLPANYLARPKAFQFIKDVATDWEHSIALQGEVGEYVVIARKDRNSPDWYLGLLTNHAARKLDVPLDFLGEGNYRAEIYRDGPNADYESDPYDLLIEKKQVSAASNLSFSLGRSGGAAVRFVPLDE